MIKVLHVMAGADAGGISSVVLNYYSFIDRAKYHFDCVITSNKIGINGEKLIELGANIYFLPLKSKDMKGYCSGLESLIKKNKYDVIHVHENDTSYVALSIAKKCGVKCRIAHAHSANIPKNIKTRLKMHLGYILNDFFSTNLIGCGKLAGEVMFGKRNTLKPKYHLLPNAIDTSRFSFQSEIREEYRKKMNLNNSFVVGMVGRISYQKNNIYGLKLFQSILNMVSNAHLVIAGNGEDELKLLQEIENLKLNNHVTFLGRVSKVNEYMQAFDLMIMPSLYEGFPVAVVEALACGLPVLLSDTITDELSFASAIHYLPLKDVSVWGEVAKKYVNDTQRVYRVNEIKNYGLDIKDTVTLLENIYIC